MIRKIPDDATPADDGAELEAAAPAKRKSAKRSSRGVAEAAAEAADGEAADGESEPVATEAEASAEAPQTDAELQAEVDADLGAAPEADAEPETPANRLPCERPLTQRLEALLFAVGSSMAPAKLARVLDEDLEAVKAALEELVGAWNEREGAIDLVEIGGGWRFMTRPAFADDLAGLAKKSKVEKLSPAALETLAIVAYRQPLGRADVEAIRGVQAGPLLRVLLDRDLIRIAGRSPEPGHPLLYGTTKRFLDHFGLPSLKALPDIKDLLDVT